MSPTPTPSDFDSTMERLKAALGARNFAETGRALGFSTSAYANRKRTGSIPYEQIVALALERGIDLNWLLCGVPRAIATRVDASTVEQIDSGLTPDQVKASLRAQGITVTEWAAQHGYTRIEVYKVLNGQVKARFGKAHAIALALGLKRQPAAQP